MWTFSAGEAWLREFQLSHTMQSQDWVRNCSSFDFCSFGRFTCSSKTIHHFEIYHYYTSAMNSWSSQCAKSLVETRSWQYDVIVCGQQRISPKLFLPSRKTGFYWCRKGAGHLAPPQTLASKQRGRKNNPKEFSSHIASNSKPGRFAQKNCRCRLESSGVVVTQVGVNDK